MSVYSNTEIIAAVKNGTIVCTPFCEEHVAEASLDFTLGNYFYKQESDESYRIYNPFDAEDVARYFKGPLEAITHKKWCDRFGYMYLKNIPLDQPIIILKPGERILAHTHEPMHIALFGYFFFAHYGDIIFSITSNYTSSTTCASIQVYR